MNPKNDDFLKQSRKQLNESADSLDAATLSRLNQARQKALKTHTKRRFMPFKLPVAGIMASISIATIAGWLWTSQLPPVASVQLAFDDEDLNMLTSNAELELLEELEFVSWLVLEQEVTPDIGNTQEQRNAG
ncbi:hypothetical protein MNBD_GAMMA09-3123 [hydrothermal vent metagenome]|uniref:DUF3619 family protein n=1 Tax=hydrothermal vent metagenome TaxID=652676 RepID=A0A3B0XUE9_9ZZZZ